MRILFVDDEIEIGAKSPDMNYMWYYCEALREAGFEVVEVPDPDMAMHKLQNDGPFDVIIVDIMLPPGHLFADCDTAEGLNTGRLLVETLAQFSPGLMILVLTNVANESVLQQLAKRPNVAEVVMKEDKTPFQLVADIKSIIEEGRE